MTSFEEGKHSYHEKRICPRTPLSMAVNYAARGEAYEDFIQDISAGGVFIETSAHFVFGQTLSITLPLPGHQRFIQVSGEVVRVSAHGIGVKFSQTVQALLSEPALPDFS
ncbi:MAG: PilZ domain-containing protein [Pseudomonadota bacterium]